MTTTQLSWSTEKRKVRDLVPAEYNPRQMTEKQAKELEKSLKKFGLVEIPAIDQDNTLLAGHMRMATMIQLGRGEEEIDVRVPNRKLTDAEAKEYNLRSNKNTGEWDMDKLFAMPDGLLEEVGWDKKEIQKLIDGHTTVQEDDYDPEEGLKQPVRVHLGEIWQLGSHRLMCGDSTLKEDVERLMDGKKADMVFTDPPYGYSFQSNYQTKHKMLENDDKILAFLPKAFNAASEDSCLYMCCSWQTVFEWLIELKASGFQLKNIIVWKKNNWSMGDLEGAYAGQHEMILFAHKGRVKLKGDRDRDVWEFDREPPTLHPTMKPVALVERALKNTSAIDSVILDLFGGSGSTLIACEQTNRKCYMMEINPRYATVILDRWEKLTNQKAIKL